MLYPGSYIVSDLLDVISLQVGIYADDTAIYSFLKSKSGCIYKNNVVAALEKDLQSVVNCGSKWLVSFNASKVNWSHLTATEKLPCPSSAWLMFDSVRVSQCVFLVSRFPIT